MLARHLDASNVVTIQINDAHAGETLESFDPNVCGQPSEEVAVGDEVAQLRYERGCIVAAAPFAGLSEVVLYEDVHTWADSWIPFWP